MRLFFELDNDSFNVENILITNDELTANLQDEKSKVAELEKKLKDLEITVKIQEVEIMLHKQHIALSGIVQKIEDPAKEEDSGNDDKNNASDSTKGCDEVGYGVGDEIETIELLSSSSEDS